MASKNYLGELLLYWCTDCDLPILGKTCACGAGTKKIGITPPGDVRPAFRYDIDLINRTTEKQFGIELIPEGRLVVLNKAPYEDRMDEVIFDGEVMGSIRFELQKMGWVFIPRLEGARLLSGGKKWVVVDKEAVDFIIRGASVLAPGVKDAEASIGEGDEVIVLSPEKEVIATGRARMTAERMLTHEKGLAVKTRWHGKITPQENQRFSQRSESPIYFPTRGQKSNTKRKRTWDDAVHANLPILKKLEEKAHSFIKNVAETTNKPVSVSYSGGKDSLATLLLVRSVVKEFDILFADTGLEFPETVDNVKQIAEDFSLPLKTYSSGDSFWQSIPDFGPPTVEARWCCKVCKLGAITQVIESSYENGCLSFIGQRKYESEIRANSEHVWKNPWVGNQIGASPIQNWTALHVWLYLFWKKAKYNPLYEQGFDRIGCWLCPSASLADFQNLKRIHPGLFQRLEDYLREYASKMGYSEEWIRYGFWRWQALPKPQEELAERLGIDTLPKNKAKSLDFNMTIGYRPCKRGEITAEGRFSSPLNLIRIEEMARAIGPTKAMEGVIYITLNGESIQIFASGTLVARSRSEEKARELMGIAEKSVRRALSCTGCGICVGHCIHKAIKIIEKKAEITEECDHCLRCLEACPAIKFSS